MTAISPASLVSTGVIVALLAFAPPISAETGVRPQAETAQAQASPELQKRVDSLFEEMKKNGGSVRYGAIEPGKSADGLVIKDLVITSKDNRPVKIAAIEIRSFDWANRQEPKFLDVSVRGAVISGEAMDEQGAQNFKELGYESLTLDANLAYKFDEPSKTLDISQLVIDVADAGEFRFALQMSGVSPADLKAATGEGADKDKKNGNDAIMGILARLNIVGAEIRYKDKSLVQRAIRMDAKKKNITEQQAKAAILADLAKERQEAKDDVTREFIDSAVKFINNPGEIRLAAKPSAPANIMGAVMLAMSNPAQLKQMLGLILSVR